MENLQIREPRVRLVRSRAVGDAVIDAAMALLAGEIVAAGGQVLRAGEGSHARLEDALGDDTADAVVAIGGTGSGRNDASVRTLARVGRVEVHGIALAPGETAAFGMVGPRPVLLLPGRLDAALAVWLVIGRRLMARLCGSTEEEPRYQGQARAQGRVGARARRGSPGSPARRRGRAHSFGLCPVAALAQAEGWILVPAESEGYPAGRRGRDKTLAMTARVEPKSAEQDLDRRHPPGGAAGAVPRGGRGRGGARALCTALGSRAAAGRDGAARGALGRVLAHDVTAPIDVPPFDRANVDGFALRSADTVGASDTAPRRLDLNGEVIVCGHPPALEVGPAPPPRSRPAAWCRAAPTPSS